ncbi:MAG: LysR family transcriptional regulator, partial [Candidatus Puniceispirillum sp.]
GVSVLPDWVITSAEMSKSTVTKPITKQGLRRQLYAATRKSDNGKAFIQRFIELSRAGKTIIMPSQNTDSAHPITG